MVDIKEAITRPAPIPMRIDATNRRGDVLRNINPTPIPISVVPPMTHELLSSFLFVFFIIVYSSFYIPFAKNYQIRNKDSVEKILYSINQ